MTRGMESVNISKAASTTNLFYLFFHGGKAALIPFLTLFFRLIGMNALEAGGIIAAKTMANLIWAPIWARCATAYNRNRLVLMFSLFMMMVTYLSFPALYTQLAKPEHCNPALNTSEPVDSIQQSPSGQQNPTESDSNLSNLTTLPPFGVSRTTISFSTTTTTSSSPSNVINPATEATEQTAAPTTPQVTTTVPEVTTETLPLEDSTASQEDTDRRDYINNEAANLLQELKITADTVLDSGLTADEFYTVVTNRAPALHITRKQVEALYEYLQLEGRRQSRDKVQKRSAVMDTDNAEEEKPGWTDQIKDKLKTIQISLQNDRLLLFLVVLAIIVGGEIFASPVEKVADDSWFDFLNRIDDLERYGQQRFWGSLAFVVIPIIVTITVDHTPCFLPFHIHHHLLHFYIFAVLTAGALIVACCFPVPPPSNTKYISKVCKSLRLICCDGRGFLFAVTLLLTGMVYAAYHNFLFWRIQDLGGKETIMGLCVSVGAFAEIPMLIFSHRLVKKLGHSWMVCVCLLTLSLRVLYYAFIPEPWAFLPIELTHGVTHTALWFAVLSYDEFNSGAALDRSLRSVLSSFYFGIGFSAGSVIAGYIYLHYDSSTLFWGCSAITGGWCILFSIVQRCIPQKEKVRYIKLLRSDSDNSEDEDDDWLEMALKDH